MKILNNDKCTVSYGLPQLKAFESMDITTDEIEKFNAPLALVLHPGYTSKKTVGFYPNLNSLISSLVCSSPREFKHYVTSYCEEFNYSSSLADLLSGEEFEKVMSYNDDIVVTEGLFKFLAKYRSELREFVYLLKVNRPSALEESYTDISSICDGSKKYYVCYLMVEDMSVFTSCISYPCNHRFSGSFNIDYSIHLPSCYDEVIENNYSMVELYSLEMAVDNCVKSINKENKDLFNGFMNKYNLTNELIYSSIIYDLIYKGISTEWRL